MFAEFGFLGIALDKVRPPTINIVAHGSPSFCAHGLELVVEELHKSGILPFGGEPNVDFRPHCGVGFPLSIDLPEQHDPMWRFPDRDGGDDGLGSVLRYFKPA